MPYLFDHVLLATLLFALLLFGCMLLAVRTGQCLAERTRRLHPGRKLGHSNAIEGALFALLGLLLAFVFSGAMTRFDARRQLIVQETNAIGTAYLRVDLLSSAAQAELRPLYREYVRSRLATYAPEKSYSERLSSYAHDQDLQARIWKRSLADLVGQQPSHTPLVVSALNEMIDITTTRYAAAFQHPPLTVYGMLFAVCLVTSLLVGYGLTGEDRPWLPLLAFIGVITIIVFVTTDVELPNLGFIRVHEGDRLLGELLASMK